MLQIEGYDLSNDHVFVIQKNSATAFQNLAGRC